MVYWGIIKCISENISEGVVLKTALENTIINVSPDDIHPDAVEILRKNLEDQKSIVGEEVLPELNFSLVITRELWGIPYILLFYLVISIFVAFELMNVLVCNAKKLITYFVP